jgi:AraC-like DNA-binding protein
VLAFMMIIFGYYVSGDGGMFYEYTVQVFGLFLVFYLLWRVETLSDLSIPLAQKDDDSSQTFRSNIGPLLKQYCEDSQLYLQHDISVSQLASLIGVNRSYLSKHFASQGITYNAYINGLRIRHFVDLYHELAAAHQPITAQQLAHQSGFHSYSTFSAAFKQIMGTTATEWMRAANESA